MWNEGHYYIIALMKVIITFTFCCDYLWKSKFMALEKPGNLREFFPPTLWPILAIFSLVCSAISAQVAVCVCRYAQVLEDKEFSKCPSGWPGVRHVVMVDMRDMYKIGSGKSKSPIPLRITISEMS